MLPIAAYYLYPAQKNARLNAAMHNVKPMRTEAFVLNQEEKLYYLSAIKRVISIIESQQTPPNLKPENDAVLDDGGCDWSKGPDFKGKWVLPITQEFTSLRGIPELKLKLTRKNEQDASWSHASIQSEWGMPQPNFNADAFTKLWA